jgi:hypothetical protein
LHQPVACRFQRLVGYFDQKIHVIALLEIDFVACHFTSPFLVNFLIQDPSLSFGRASSPGPSSYRPTKEAGATARQGSLPRNYHSSGMHLTGDELLPLHWM